jgi:hypothetical protein
VCDATKADAKFADDKIKKPSTYAEGFDYKKLK